MQQLEEKLSKIISEFKSFGDGKSLAVNETTKS